MIPKISKDARILIVGAGPAGLSHAHFLRKAGYDKVDILEINGKVGGKSHSLTFEHKSFDLGANYLTPDYVEILKMAKEVGAETYAEKNPIAFNPETGGFKPLLKAVMEETTFFAFAKSCVRYYFIRWKLNAILPKAGNMGIANDPELMVSFKEWLENNKLSNLKRLFSIPVTMMVTVL
jgi:monoamine oxidase